MRRMVVDHDWHYYKSTDFDCSTCKVKRGHPCEELTSTNLATISCDGRMAKAWHANEDRARGSRR